MVGVYPIKQWTAWKLRYFMERNVSPSGVPACCLLIILFAIAAPVLAEPPVSSPHEGGKPVASVDALVDGLAARLRIESNDVKGWALLARSYAYLGRVEDARMAAARAVELGYDGPDLLATPSDHSDIESQRFPGPVRRSSSLIDPALIVPAPAHADADQPTRSDGVAP